MFFIFMKLIDPFIRLIMEPMFLLELLSFVGYI